MTGVSPGMGDEVGHGGIFPLGFKLILGQTFLIYF